MKIPSIVTAITSGLAFSGLTLSMPTNGALASRASNTDWMLKCSHGGCYSIVGCTSLGAVTHNDGTCWQMCTCVAVNSTVPLNKPVAMAKL
ncbi:hypothetical protein diail_12123 [Diaporthe ilicicola]|nr:hypothetical protein diail_12123 [Diaporthe ilicicola]